MGHGNFVFFSFWIKIFLSDLALIGRDNFVGFFFWIIVFSFFQVFYFHFLFLLFFIFVIFIFFDWQWWATIEESTTKHPKENSLNLKKDPEEKRDINYKSRRKSLRKNINSKKQELQKQLFAGFLENRCS